MTTSPKVQVTILARDKEDNILEALEQVENIDYDTKSIQIYAHTNNNNDNTGKILKKWCALKKEENIYADVVFIEEHFPELDGKPGRTCERDWYSDSGIRLIKLAEVRQKSLLYSVSSGCDFYFVCDIDNFFPSNVVRYCVEANRPIIGPMMLNTHGTYPNSFYLALNNSGYYGDHPYSTILFNLELKGIIEVKLVHVCYMIRCDEVHKGLDYCTDGVQMEFVTFAASARKAGVKMYMTNEVTTLLQYRQSYAISEETCANMKFTFPRIQDKLAEYNKSAL